MDRSYSTKSAAIRGMWRYYDRHIRPEVGSPLVGDGGTALQWCDGWHTRYMSVTTDDQGNNILIKSWDD